MAWLMQTLAIAVGILLGACFITIVNTVTSVNIGL